MAGPSLHCLLARHRLSHWSFLLSLFLLFFVLCNFGGCLDMSYIAFLSRDPLCRVAWLFVLHCLLWLRLFLFFYRLIDDCSLLSIRLLFPFFFYSVFLIIVFIHIGGFLVITACLLLRRLFRTILFRWTGRWILIVSSWVHSFVFFISFLMDASSTFRVLFGLFRGKGNLSLNRCDTFILLGLRCSKGSGDNVVSACARRLVASCDVKLELFFRA